MKNILLLLLALLLASIKLLNAQSNFVGYMPGNGIAGPSEMVADDSGNVILCGIFTDSMDIDLSNTDQVIYSNGDEDGWIAKYDAAGSLLWGFAIGGNANQAAKGLAIDEFNNIYVVGYYAGTVDFDQSPGTSLLTSQGDWDTFVLKLDDSGNFIWAKSFGGSNRQFPTEVVCNQNGNIYISGTLSGSTNMDMNGGTFLLTPNASGGGNEANTGYYAKYNYNGDLIWAYNVAGINPEIALGNENGLDVIYYLGHGVANPLSFDDFDPSAAVLQPVPSPFTSANYFALIKYNDAGQVIWSKFSRTTISSAGTDVITKDVAVDLSGDIYVAGDFYSGFDLYPGNDMTLNAYGITGTDGFLVKYSSAGNFIWEKQFGTSDEYDYAEEIAIDSWNNVWVSGGFRDIAEMNSSGTSHTLTSAGLNDIFAAGFTSSGNYIWSGSVSGPATDGAPQMLAAGNNLLISGFFIQTADCDITSGVNNLTAQQFSDVFFASFINPGATTGITESIREVQFSCFPNPASEKVIVNFTLLQPSKIKIVLAAMNGAVLDSRESGYNNAVMHTETFIISNNIASQYVQLIIYVDDVKTYAKKVMILEKD
ncbi:MAG: hypothetical protein IPL22_00605 [Bacteroidetes bacterium]|nr:hypothetical protein [Bacteroidota bacterium]